MLESQKYENSWNLEYFVYKLKGKQMCEYICSLWPISKTFDWLWRWRYFGISLIARVEHWLQKIRWCETFLPAHVHAPLAWQLLCTVCAHIWCTQFWNGRRKLFHKSIFFHWYTISAILIKSASQVWLVETAVKLIILTHQIKCWKTCLHSGTRMICREIEEGRTKQRPSLIWPDGDWRTLTADRPGIMYQMTKLQIDCRIYWRSIHLDLTQ